MKGKVECTIPQRQYENIKITYEFNSSEEKILAVDMIIKDCQLYHNCVKADLDKTVYGVQEISGVKWRQDPNGNWSYYDKDKLKWIESDPDITLPKK